jgi:hypothetical protein
LQVEIQLLCFTKNNKISTKNIDSTFTVKRKFM